MASSNTNLLRKNINVNWNNSIDCTDEELFCSKNWYYESLIKPVDLRNSSINLIEAIETMVDKITFSSAETYNLSPSVVVDQIPPVDILIFGRSGVGKSSLINAMTNIQVPSSPDIDHVTQTMNCTILNNGKLKFRFWDTKGIDKWDNTADVENMFNEIKTKQIVPLFIIYCASTNGRVDSKIVTKILLDFKQYNVPIAYVITNIYAGADEQFDGQRKGAFQIMNDVFFVKPRKISEYYYEYGALYHTDGELITNGKGILICVNSQPYIRKRGNINYEQLNINELLDYLGNHLNGEHFAKFVILTLNNRTYWKQKYDYLISRLEEISHYLYRWRNKLTQMLSGFK